MSLLSIIEMCGGKFLASLAPNLSEQPAAPRLEGTFQSPMFEVSICLVDLPQWS